METKKGPGNGIIIRKDEQGRERPFLMCGASLVPVRLVDRDGKEWGPGANGDGAALPGWPGCHH